MSIKQLSVFVENKFGRVSDICNVLADNHINMSALSIADTSEFGVARIIVDHIVNGNPVAEYTIGAITE